MGELEKTVTRTNWKRLRKQKAWLLQNTHESELVEELLCFIDEIQQAAIKDGLATEIQVLGKIKYK